MGKGNPYLLPSISDVIALADPDDRDAFNSLSRVKTEPMDIDMVTKEEVRVLMYCRKLA